jgi:hypothetical protein
MDEYAVLGAPTDYELFSVVVHKGGPYGVRAPAVLAGPTRLYPCARQGHYHAYIRDRMHEGKWERPSQSYATRSLAQRALLRSSHDPSSRAESPRRTTTVLDCRGRSHVGAQSCGRAVFMFDPEVAKKDMQIPLVAVRRGARLSGAVAYFTCPLQTLAGLIESAGGAVALDTLGGLYQAKAGLLISPQTLCKAQLNAAWWWWWRSLRRWWCRPVVELAAQAKTRPSEQVLRTLPP